MQVEEIVDNVFHSVEVYVALLNEVAINTVVADELQDPWMCVQVYVCGSRERCDILYTHTSPKQ